MTAFDVACELLVEADVLMLVSIDCLEEEDELILDNDDDADEEDDEGGDDARLRVDLGFPRLSEKERLDELVRNSEDDGDGFELVMWLLSVRGRLLPEGV